MWFGGLVANRCSFSLASMIRTDVWVVKGHFKEIRLCGHSPFVPCHSERSEESEVCECCMCNDFRFFTPLRCIQNDRDGMAAFGMTMKGRSE